MTVQTCTSAVTHRAAETPAMLPAFLCEPQGLALALEARSSSFCLLQPFTSSHLPGSPDRVSSSCRISGASEKGFIVSPLSVSGPSSPLPTPGHVLKTNEVTGTLTGVLGSPGQDGDPGVPHHRGARAWEHVVSFLPCVWSLVRDIFSPCFTSGVPSPKLDSPAALSQ